MYTYVNILYSVNKELNWIELNSVFFFIYFASIYGNRRPLDLFLSRMSGSHYSAPPTYLLTDSPHYSLWYIFWHLRRRFLFPFRKRSLPFLTVNATIGNQAFSHDSSNIFLGLSYNKTNNTFLNTLRKNDIEVKVEFTLKIRVICNWCNSYERQFASVCT